MNKSILNDIRFLIVDEQSTTSPISMGRSDRIEISVSVPQLNIQFDLNQSANGQTRLLLMLVHNKLRVWDQNDIYIS